MGLSPDGEGTVRGMSTTRPLSGQCAGPSLCLLPGGTNYAAAWWQVAPRAAWVRVPTGADCGCRPSHPLGWQEEWEPNALSPCVVTKCRERAVQTMQRHGGRSLRELLGFESQPVPIVAVAHRAPSAGSISSLHTGKQVDLALCLPTGSAEHAVPFPVPICCRLWGTPSVVGGAAS